jgi:hypothetical protein
MIESLRIQNFRCYEDHVVPFRDLSVVIGRNNAGKSSLIEALRFVALALLRHRTTGFYPPPTWAMLPQREVGIQASLRGLDISRDLLYHRYGNPPSIFEARFSNGAMVRIYLGDSEKLHVVLNDPRGNPVRSRTATLALALPKASILPQIGPLNRNESVLDREYIRDRYGSSLTSLHFRNQLLVFAESFPLFQELATETWPGLSISRVETVGPSTSRELLLNVRSDDFVAEVGSMGHGLQMWLQTIWFLARSDNSATVILDEPDVYMHPDLQRRLVRVLKQRFPQVIIATHSVEIIAEAEPDNILILDRSSDSSSYAGSLPAVQQLIDHVGSVHNLQLAKLAHSRRCLFVEGKDARILASLYDVVYPADQDGLRVHPTIEVGGWGGWQYAVGSAMLIRAAAPGVTNAYCVLDSDYHTPEEIEGRYDEADRHDIRLHIWSRKELENFLLIPSVLERYIRSRAPARVTPPLLSEIEAKVDELVDLQKDAVFDAIANDALVADRSRGVTGANRIARQRVEAAWETADGRRAAVSGKRVLGLLSEWTQSEFGVTVGAATIARTILPGEMAPEVREVLTAIHDLTDMTRARSAKRTTSPNPLE